MTEIKNVIEAFDYLGKATFRTAERFQEEITIDTEPFWAKQIRKFRQGLDLIKAQPNPDEAIQSFVDVVRDVYSENSIYFTEEIMGEHETKMHDDFVRIPESERHNNTGRKRNKGIFFDFKATKVLLPVSEPFMAAVELSRRTQDKTLPYPIEILYGLYSLVYQANKDTMDSAESKALLNNLEILRECREACDEVIEKPKGPLGTIQNLLSSFDTSKIGEMVGNLTQNPQVQQQFGDVLSVLGDTVRGGQNPVDAVKDIAGKLIEQMPNQEGKEPMNFDEALNQGIEMINNVMGTQQVGVAPGSSSGSRSVEVDSGVSLSDLAEAEEPVPEPSTSE